MIPGEAIIAQRKRMKISQFKLAEKLSIAYGQPIHQSTVSAWETGKIAPTDDILIVMCKIAEKHGRIKDKIAGTSIPYQDRAHINDLSTGVTRRITIKDTTALAEEMAEARMDEIQKELDEEREKEMQETVTDGQNEFLEAEISEREQKISEREQKISEREQKIAESKESHQKPLNGPQMTFLALEEKMFAIYRSAECLKEHEIDGAPEVLELAQIQLAQMAGMQYE